DAVIQSRMITRQIESAQERIDGNNYDTRRNVLRYDDVMREQREVIYSQREEIIIQDESLSYVTIPIIQRTMYRYVDLYTKEENTKDWNLSYLVEFANTGLLREESLEEKDLEGKTAREIRD